MVFFTELIGKEVIDNTGKTVGTLCDFVFQDGTEFAPVTHIIFLAKDKYKKKISWEYVEGIKQQNGYLVYSIVLNIASAEMQPLFVHETDLLAHELLDKQIIDVSGVKVVRVNDILLNKVEAQFCITGVCVGSTSFLRRLGVKQQLLGKILYKFSSEKIIPWKSVEPLETKEAKKETKGQLHLKEAKNKIAEMHPGDLADLMEELSPKEQMLIFNRLDKKTAAKTFVEAGPKVQESFFKGLKINRLVDLLESMPPHSAADVLGILEEQKAKVILAQMNAQKAKQIHDLMQYPEDTAGGLMRTDYFALRDTDTATKAVAHIRKAKPSADKTHVLLIIDQEHHLVGTLSMRTLLTAKPRQQLKTFMKKKPLVVFPQTTKQDLATALEKYNFYMIPVVDEQSTLKGIITADQVLSEVIPKSWIRRKFILKRAKRQKRTEQKNNSTETNGTVSENNQEKK